MTLTKLEAINKSIEAWEELAERGCKKGDIEWLGRYAWSCPLCQYTVDTRNYSDLRGKCDECPLPGNCTFRCVGTTPFGQWQDANTPTDRKHYAHLFLEVLYQVKRDYVPEPEPVKKEWVDITQECAFTILDYNQLAIECTVGVVAHVRLESSHIGIIWYCTATPGKYKISTQPSRICGRPQIIVHKEI